MSHDFNLCILRLIASIVELKFFVSSSLQQLTRWFDCIHSGVEILKQGLLFVSLVSLIASIVELKYRVGRENVLYGIGLIASIVELK